LAIRVKKSQSVYLNGLKALNALIYQD